MIVEDEGEILYQELNDGEHLLLTQDNAEGYREILMTRKVALKLAKKIVKIFGNP